MDMSVTKLSSKGQIVIPVEMRKDIREGEKLVIIRNKNQIIVEKVSEFSKKLEEDLEFARRTEEAWRKYEKGEFVEMEFDEFLKELKKW
ncbi:AbrB/MazE/SpoVT family DNA-binding domain-containing protein [Candidatus Woesearchaeota archaeon]|nr:AbrB/MazE/SpoVT family DNA-binding domain-containing protein [Candidatus Woesearchaeota archaeon]